MIRRSIAIILVGTTTWISTWAAAPGWAQSSQQSELTQEQAIAHLSRYIELIQDLRSRIDRSSFDLDSLLEKLDYDSKNITDFVKQRIAFQQYPGVLRGAKGCLMSRSGNTLDQSLLLATLLRDAGFEARILSGSLQRQQIDELLQEIGSPIETNGNHFDAGAREVASEIGTLLGSIEPAEPSTAESQQPLLSLRDAEAQADTHFELLRQELHRNQIPLQNQPLNDQFYAEAQQYFWVQYRTEAATDWLDVHPAFSDQPSTLDDLNPTNTYVNQVPSEHHQTISVQAFASRRIGERLETIPLMSVWERPVANLIETPITFANAFTAPDSWPNQDPQEDAFLFIPMLNGVPAPDSIAFTMQGATAPSGEAFSPMAGIFQQLGSTTGRAAGALSALGTASSEGEPPDPMMALEDVWLEIEHTTPGAGGSSVWRRSLASHPSRSRITASEVAQRITINLSTGSLPTAYLLDGLLLQHATTLRLAILQAEGYEDQGLWEELNSSRDLFVYDRNILFNTLVELSPGTDSEVASYRPAPLIVATYMPLLIETGAVSGMDIIQNPRRSIVNAAGGSKHLSPSSTLFEGVWETLAESILGSLLSDQSFNTIRYFEESIENKSGVESLTSPEQATNLRWASPEVMSMIVQSLERGAVVVIPSEASAESSSRTAWWKVDPETGQTLGIIDNGWGGDMVEYKATDVVTGVTMCVVVAVMGCRTISKWLRAEVGFLLALGYNKAIGDLIVAMMGGGGLPPDIDYDWANDPIAGEPLRRLLDYFEKKMFERCLEGFFPKCIAAVLK